VIRFKSARTSHWGDTNDNTAQTLNSHLLTFTTDLIELNKYNQVIHTRFHTRKYFGYHQPSSGQQDDDVLVICLFASINCLICNACA
jgi:hypothetical protein